MAKRPSKDLLATPRMTCPFSGEPLQFVEVPTMAAGHIVRSWQVRGVGWASTKLFPSREHAEWFFSHREGAEPSFQNPYRAVQMREREPDDTADSVKMVEDAEKIAQQMGAEMERSD